MDGGAGGSALSGGAGLSQGVDQLPFVATIKLQAHEQGDELKVLAPATAIRRASTSSRPR